MIYIAPRYSRMGDGPHPCPDVDKRYPAMFHNLERDRANALPNMWVCLHTLGQELSEARLAQMEADADAERQAKAERIAADMIGDAAEGDSILSAASIRDMLTAAVIAGMEVR